MRRIGFAEREMGTFGTQMKEAKLQIVGLYNRILALERNKFELKYGERQEDPEERRAERASELEDREKVREEERVEVLE